MLPDSRGLSALSQTPQLLMHPGDKGTGDLSQSSPISRERRRGSFLKVLGHRGAGTPESLQLTLQALSEPQECQRGGSSSCNSSLRCLHDGSFVLQPHSTGIQAHGQLDGRNRRMCASQALVPAMTARCDLALQSHSLGGAHAAPALTQPWSSRGLVCTPGPHFPGLR